MHSTPKTIDAWLLRLHELEEGWFVIVTDDGRLRSNFHPVDKDIDEYRGTPAHILADLLENTIYALHEAGLKSVTVHVEHYFGKKWFAFSDSATAVVQYRLATYELANRLFVNSNYINHKGDAFGFRHAALEHSQVPDLMVNHPKLTEDSFPAIKDVARRLWSLRETISMKELEDLQESYVLARIKGEEEELTWLTNFIYEAPNSTLNFNTDMQTPDIILAALNLLKSNSSVSKNIFRKEAVSLGDRFLYIMDEYFNSEDKSW